MEYLNFEVQIRGAGDDKYEIVVTSPAGEVSAPMEFRRDELQMPLQRLGNARGSGPPRADLATDPAPESAMDAATDSARDPNATRWSSGSREKTAFTEPATTTARTVGDSLFKSFLPTEKLRLSYHRSLAQAQTQKQGLRIRLRIEPAELQALPWEFAFNESDAVHVALSVETPITRYLDVFEPQKAMTVERPLRILGMISTPKGLSPLNTQGERDRMKSAIHHLTEAGQVELHWLEGQTALSLKEKLEEQQWHVLHYIGHGGFDKDRGEGFLSFADSAGGEDRFTADQLSSLLKSTSLNLVVLNSCEGARSSDSNLFSSTAARLIETGMPAVVSMQYEITDHAAVEFSREFYGSLAKGRPVDYAVQKSRKWIKDSKGDTVEWATPVLFMRAPDGRLFNIEKNALIEKGRIENASTHRSFHAGRIQRDPDVAKLINRLRRELENSNWSTHDVVEPRFEEIRSTSKKQEAIDEASQIQNEINRQSIHDRLNSEGGVTLMLSAPGAGVTAVLRGMYLDQLEWAYRDESQPVPILIHLSSWNNEPLDEWLADQIADKHMMTSSKAQSWIKAGLMQLYLDGMDEIRHDQRLAFPQAFNRFAKEFSSAGIVVSCLEKEYSEPSKLLRYHSAFRLTSLTANRIDQYLSRLGAEMDGLRDALKEDSSLAILAQSPLMLSLMVKVYRDRQTSEVADTHVQSAGERREELMKAYVRMMFDRQRSQQDD